MDRDFDTDRSRLGRISAAGSPEHQVRDDRTRDRR
jgi:hypothetical protein